MKDLKRGRNVALVGAVLQAIFALLAVILWRTTGSRAMFTTWWLLLGGLPLWLMTALLFYVRMLAEREARELEELAAGADESRLFSQAERLEMRPAERRVAFMERWAVRGLTLAMAAYQITLGMLMVQRLRATDATTPEGSGPAAAFLALVVVISFLYSRYCTGMSKRAQWSLLRATGAYLLVCMGVEALLFVAMLASATYPIGEVWISYVPPVIMVIYGLELILGFVMDIYRPRVPGAAYRPAYDSRLFNLLAEFGRVGHSIADTINYQFGFEVSRTWFYQLVSRAIVPLLIFAMAALALASSFVVVEDGESCIIKVWGRPIEGPNGAKVFGPGAHWKWPWPIATTERIGTGRMHTLILGVGEEKAPAQTADGRELIVWSEDHGIGGQAEEDFLIGVPKQQVEEREQEGQAGAAAYAVSVIRLVVVVQYRITDAYRWAYGSSDSGTLLESLSREEMMKYCAAATLDTRVSDATDRPQAIMTWGRAAAAQHLQERIQKRVEEAGLGVSIQFVGIVSAHPPAEVIPEYEKVLEAERLQDKQRYEAQAQASEVLAEVAGQPGQALQLYLSIHAEQVYRNLQKDRNDEVRFAASVGEYIRRTRGQIESLKQELQRERLLGRQEADLADTQRLKERYETMLGRLEAIRKDPKGYDYDAAIAASSGRTESLFDQLDGTPAKLVAEARASRWEAEQKAWTAVEVYRRKLLPYHASPTVYRFDRMMDVYDEVLPEMQKYVLGADPKQVEIRLNLERTASDYQEGVVEAIEDSANK